MVEISEEMSDAIVTAGGATMAGWFAKEFSQDQPTLVGVGTGVATAYVLWEGLPMI